MKRMHTEQEIKELAQEQITQSQTIAELQAKIAAIDSKANVFEFEGSVNDLDADALMALYEANAQILILDDVGSKQAYYLDFANENEMQYFNLSVGAYNHFTATRETTDSPWALDDFVEQDLAFAADVGTKLYLHTISGLATGVGNFTCISYDKTPITTVSQLGNLSKRSFCMNLQGPGTIISVNYAGNGYELRYTTSSGIDSVTTASASAEVTDTVTPL